MTLHESPNDRSQRMVERSVSLDQPDERYRLGTPDYINLEDSYDDGPHVIILDDRQTHPLTMWSTIIMAGMIAALAMTLVLRPADAAITNSYVAWLGTAYSMFMFFKGLANYGQNSDYFEKHIDYRAGAMIIVSLALFGVIFVFWILQQPPPPPQPIL